jgi:hypothetical protein
MKTLNELVRSAEVAFGMYHRAVECENFQDFCENAEIGQKWIDTQNETCFYKIVDEAGNVIVFEILSGRAYRAN